MYAIYITGGNGIRRLVARTDLKKQAETIAHRLSDLAPNAVVEIYKRGFLRSTICLPA